MRGNKGADTNPYVGPRPFSYAEHGLFFGREREARDLLARVLSERLLLFYAQSGAGKSSLLHTRLVPQLCDNRGFAVLPVGRVSGEISPDATEPANVFVFNLLRSIDQSNEPGRLVGVTLNDFLARLTYRDQRWVYDDAIRPDRAAQGNQRYALIIDQFEEIFTTHDTHWSERAGFFRQLDRAMAIDPNLWVVLTIREDFVAALDPYALLLADHLRGRYYMERMNVDAALAAVQEPARIFGRPFASGVAEQLVDDLRRIRLAGQAKTVPGQYVEPVQLQVVCYQLWDKLTQRDAATAQDRDSTATDVQRTTITFDDLEEAGDADCALAAYYLTALNNVLAHSIPRISERSLRMWFSTELITAAGTRSTLFRDEAKGVTAGLANLAVDLLARRFLVRCEARAGGIWVELIHDRFITPILDSNREWLQRQSPLLQQAQRWSEDGRDPALLYASQQLIEKALHDKSADPLVAEFLAASQAQVDAERERQAAHLRTIEAQIQANEAQKRADLQERNANILRRRAWYLAAALVVAALAAAAATWLFQLARIAQQDAEQARDAAQSLRLAAESVIARTASPQRGLLLAVAATQLDAQAAGSRAPATEQALRAQFDQWEYWRANLGERRSTMRDVAFSPTADRIYAVNLDGTVLTWAIETPDPQPTELLKRATASDSIAVHPDGAWLATGWEDGQIIALATAASRAQIGAWQAHRQGYRVLTLAFSADGRWLISGGADGLIRFWSASQLAAPPLLEIELPSTPACAPECWVRTLAISPDGKWLVAGGEDRYLRFWSLAGNEPTLAFEQALLGKVRTVAFSQDGRRLGAGDDSGAVTLYDLAIDDNAPPWRAARQIDPIALAAVGALAFAPTSDWLAVADDMGSIGKLALGATDEAVILVGRTDAPVQALDYSPDGALLASAIADNPTTAAADGFVALWHTSPDNQEPKVAYVGTDQLRVVASYPLQPATGQPSQATTLVTAGEDGAIRLWAEHPKLVAQQMITETGNNILAATVSPNGAWLASAGRDGQVRLYALPYTGAQPPQVLGRHTDEVLAVAFSPDSRWLASGAADRTVRIWSLAAPETAPIVLTNDQGGFLALAFSPDGQRLATGDEALRVKLWDWAASAPAGQTLYTHDDWVWAVAFSPNGSVLASISADSMLRLSPVTDGAVAQGPVFAHERRGRAVAFNGTGTLLATAGDDGIVRLWDASDLSQPPTVLDGHTGIVRAVAFSADGRRVASVADDGTLRVWTATADDLQAEACARLARELGDDEWQRYLPHTPHRTICPDTDPS